MRILTLMIVLSAAAAAADEVTYQFRSVEDPAFPPDASLCSQAPFRVNVLLGASLWSQETREHDGKVAVPQARRIGKATACVQLTNFLFPPGLQQNFYVVFELPSGRYTANGTCTLTSNDVPQAGLVLAGCALKLIGAPAHVLGGAVSSLSTFNPAHLAGFSTGSVWTVQAYTDGEAPPRCAGHEQKDLQHHEDSRSDAEIEAARARAVAP